jgi:hypothetical protein
MLTSSSSNAYATSGALDNLTARQIVVTPYAMIVVRSHVPVVLELKKRDFNKWALFFFHNREKFRGLFCIMFHNSKCG